MQAINDVYYYPTAEEANELSSDTNDNAHRFLHSLLYKVVKETRVGGRVIRDTSPVTLNIGERVVAMLEELGYEVDVSYNPTTFTVSW